MGEDRVGQRNDHLHHGLGNLAGSVCSIRMRPMKISEVQDAQNNIDAIRRIDADIVIISGETTYIEHDWLIKYIKSEILLNRAFEDKLKDLALTELKKQRNACARKLRQLGVKVPDKTDFNEFDMAKRPSEDAPMSEVKEALEKSRELDI